MMEVSFGGGETILRIGEDSSKKRFDRKTYDLLWNPYS